MPRMSGKLAVTFVVLTLVIATVAVVSILRFASLHDNNPVVDVVRLSVNLSEPVLPIPKNLFGVNFQEVNNAGAGGIWGEQIDNRGFEAGGHANPPNIAPWSTIGTASTLTVSTDHSSCFKHNKVALKLNVTCDTEGDNICPDGGVGVYNPGFWGMNIESGKVYKLEFFVRSLIPLNITVALSISNDEDQSSIIPEDILVSQTIITSAPVANWTKMECFLKPKRSNSNSRFQLMSTRKGVVWFDQISLMPTDTYKGHGFRKDLVEKVIGLEPRFIRFPGGDFVHGEQQINAFHWKQTVGPWQERPGHYDDSWMYWTDDGLGYFELLQFVEDVRSDSVWVINCGLSTADDEIGVLDFTPFVQDMLDSIEFARGNQSTHWGSLRARMGHPESFDLKYVAIGSENCDNDNYRVIYYQFYDALKKAYPDIQVISNCDLVLAPIDLYDHPVSRDANEMFADTHLFDNTDRGGSKVFVNKYAVAAGKDIGNGTLLAALAEAAFLIGIEQNSDVVEMASNSQLFANSNNQQWHDNAIVFDSFRVYATPSYWMQQMFTKSNGGSLLKTTIQGNSSKLVVASVVRPMEKCNRLQKYLFNYQGCQLRKYFSPAQARH